MKVKKKLMVTFVLTLIFSVLVMPTAFADGEAEPTTEDVFAETGEESSADNTPASETLTEQMPTADEDSTQETETADTLMVEERDNTEATTEKVENSESNEPMTITDASTYTVEFVNSEDGSEVKIVGGENILFSDINMGLGLDFNWEDILSIESSNPELFFVEKSDGDYIIHTLQPFSSSEQLLICLSDAKLISVDVFDANYSSDEGFLAIADSFTTEVSVDDLSTCRIPTNDSVVKIQYLEKTWDVIGFNGSGIGAGPDQLMLLLDDIDGTSAYRNAWQATDAKEYAKSDLKTAMEEYLATITADKDEEMVALLAEMTLAGDKSYSSTKPYCDGVAGASVTSKIRPLTTQEAMILTNFNADFSDAVTSASDYYWLASPDYYCAATVYYYGLVKLREDGFVNQSRGLRPALLLNLTSNIATSALGDGVYKLVLDDEPEPTPAAGNTVPVYVPVWVYVDGNLIAEGTDYNRYNGMIVLTDEFVKTLSEGSHRITVLYTDAYAETLPTDFEYTAKNSDDFVVSGNTYIPETNANIIK